MSEMLWQYHNMQQNPASLVRQDLLGRPASQGKWLARWGQVLAPKQQKLATVKRDQKRPVPICANKKNHLFNINTKKWPLLPFLATGLVKKAASASGSVFFFVSLLVTGAWGSWQLEICKTSTVDHSCKIENSDSANSHRKHQKTWVGPTWQHADFFLRSNDRPWKRQSAGYNAICVHPTLDEFAPKVDTHQKRACISQSKLNPNWFAE